MASNYTDYSSFGEPDILPRIGHEYQAELPQIIGVSDYISNTKARAHSCKNFFVGLPIPLTSLKQDTVKPKDGKMRKWCGLLVPGLTGESWNDAEKASFNLGLYIFEKNSVNLSQFVETKKTGDIMRYYYGEFYGSDEYFRWSDRKTKRKKYVFGQRIISEWRQQELLSRLFGSVSEECKSALLEVSKTFEDEKMSLVDYVASLKAMVGIRTLVEAIAIGRGRKDLTRIALESSRSNQVIPARQKIQVGKEWASLGVSEIIEFLRGDYRLSKAWSNSLFWEAVWPRLLARGWHSEQPGGEGCNGPKNSLVFLMPGIERFSRGELVKGDHYFGSVIDVLAKVAREPGLIELDKELHEPPGSEGKSEENGNDDRHIYLRPSTCNRGMHAMKFSLVDKSPGGKLRDLRTIPIPSEKSNMSISVYYTEDRDPEILEEKNGESDLKDLNDKSKFRRARKQKTRNVDSKCFGRSIDDTHDEETRDGASCSSTGPESDHGPSCHNVASPSGDKLSCAGPSEGSPSKYPGYDPIGSTRPAEPTTEGSRTRLSFDLNNLPQEFQETEQGNDLNEARNEDQRVVSMDPPRQSTRHRPLTAKALEAIADGYLTKNRKRRGSKVIDSHKGLASRSSKRVRAMVGPDECPSSTCSTAKVGENDVSDGRNCNCSG